MLSFLVVILGVTKVKNGIAYSFVDLQNLFLQRPFNRVSIILLSNRNIKIKVNLLRMTYNFN